MIKLVEFFRFLVSNTTLNLFRSRSFIVFMAKNFIDFNVLLLARWFIIAIPMVFNFYANI
jgi:hypothetical protein